MPIGLHHQSAAERLRLLELRLRRQSQLLVLLGLVVGVCFVLGAGPEGFQEIKARRFIVTDEQDNPRGLLTSHKGTTTLSLFDATGASRARLAILDDGHPELTLLDKDGQELIALAERDGAVRLTLADARGLGKLVIGQTGDQFGLDLTASDSEHSLQLRAGEAQPQVAAISADGQSVLQVFARNDKSGLSISAKDGQPGVILAVLEQLRPLLMLQSSDRRTLLTPTEPIPVKSADASDAPIGSTQD